jgi:hypothetical protein
MLVGAAAGEGLSLGLIHVSTPESIAGYRQTLNT